MQEHEMKTTFSRELLAWYRRGNRDLPWRRSQDPYYIWVSEIMLQQTRVDTVIPYFNRFVERFPTVRDLAEAPEADVLKHWEGLGYYSRARNLQAAAQEVAERYGGKIPDDIEAVRGLKGVGPYTSGAILSIAFGRPEPAVDGNVMRVLSRYFCIDDDIARPATRPKMESLARELIPEGAAGDFNQALMELGAMVCTPRSPQCLICPVTEHCAGRLAGREEELPVKTKAKPPKPQHRLAVLAERADGRVLVRQRPSRGLLARLWELPHVEAPSESIWGSAEQGPRWLAETLALEGVSVSPARHACDAEHVFSHLHWYVRVWGADGAMFDPELAPDVSAALGPAGAAALREAAATYAAAAELAAAAGSAAVRPRAAAEEAGMAAAPARDAAEPVPAHGDAAASGVSAARASTPAGEDALPDGYRWIDGAEFERLAWPNVFRKILADHFAGRG
ncbi:A/G-specific adenine glycosylase [Cohnella lubricantis]|uniref:Adenine DNA glycosylase n=1 Tax=Cohnella lubricantis TaxID=2163172 RepID=A0A841TFV9_9BACL|nr:A/G-specific adenine glycosylase [Cohnella lubricantis]MBB6678985.1 A/G-specific adenine glycosylase [Cohnella lubricantis]MBP2118794.1 A/G-specific adenine glycosylase [Cohnella lubricantis]